MSLCFLIKDSKRRTNLRKTSSATECRGLGLVQTGVITINPTHPVRVTLRLGTKTAVLDHMALKGGTVVNSRPN